MIQKEFIRSELRYRYPDLIDQIRAPLQQVGRPLLFENGARKFGARIIVCTGEELDSLQAVGQSEPLFLTIGTPNKETINVYDVCVLPQDEQVGVVLNFVQRLFDRLDDWTQSLRQAAETGVEAEELLSRASEMLQNPVLLLDERGHIVAQSERVDATAIARFSDADKLQNIDLELNIVYKLGEAALPDALLVRLQSGEVLYTLLCAANNRPLYASDEIVFESLAGFLRLMLSQRTLRFGSYRQRRENEAAAVAFRSLLSQDRPEQITIDTLNRLGWSENNEYAVLAIEPIDGDLRAAQADDICDLLESSLDECCAFTILPVIVTVVRSGLLESDALQNKLHSLAETRKLRIGVCESFLGFSFFVLRLSQAKQAINHAADFGGATRLSDFVEQEIAAQSISAFPKELICMRSILALATFDRSHGTNYLETTEQYVKNRFNAVKTAGELFIHRSTLLYRLERIKAQFGLDLDDKQIPLLHLLLSLQLVKDL